MRRRDKTGSKVKARRHKALALKAMRRRSSSLAGRETNVARLSRELSESFEQQAATAEILNVISNSPTDTQPVFDAIVQSGLKLFPGALVSVALRYGDTINAAAVAAPDPARVEAWRRTISRTPSRGITCTAEPCLIAGSWIFPTWWMPRRNLSPGPKTS